MTGGGAAERLGKGHTGTRRTGKSDESWGDAPAETGVVVVSDTISVNAAVKKKQKKQRRRAAMKGASTPIILQAVSRIPANLAGL